MQFRWNVCLLFSFSNILIFVHSEREPLCVYGPDAIELNRRFVREHNEFRKKHGVPLLYSNHDLIEMSINWSFDLAEEDVLKRSKPDGVYGENLYWSSVLPEGFNTSRISPIQSWYSEKTQYTGDLKTETRNFAQIVWKSTCEVGCGVCSSSGGTYVTCRYIPAGNIRGKFKENVPPLITPKLSSPDSGITLRSVTSAGTPATYNPSKDSNILIPLLYALSIAIVVFSLIAVIIFSFMICYYTKRFFQL